MAQRNAPPSALAVCIRNQGYEASLELRKLYRIIADPEAAKHRQLRVVDESGEGYLYPAGFFFAVKLPESVERAVLGAA
jgi:hypothetical protein